MCAEADKWIELNSLAVDIAQKNLTKKGDLIIPFEKPWPAWEIARAEADKAWFAWMDSLRNA